jgi:DNA-binding CsgD family transcriptional regulator
MSIIFSKHPIFHNAGDIADLCRPLLRLNITYFAHIQVDEEGHFSGIANNPRFGEHYLRNRYYNADIHLASTSTYGKYVLWDTIERKGRSLKMHQEAAEFGVQHTFTIIEKGNGITDCYHFANHANDCSINQIYLANLDLLKLFILHFKEAVRQSSILLSAFDYKFRIDKNAAGFTAHTTMNEQAQQNNRLLFLNDLKCKIKTNDMLSTLSPQRMKCLKLLAEGHSAKQIADLLKLSTRTIENYLAYLRDLFDCRNSKELIAAYYSALQYVYISNFKEGTSFELNE